MSSQCINSTSCALAPSVCTCPATSSSSSSATRHLLQDGGSTGSNDTTSNSSADGNGTASNGTDVQLGLNETAGSTCNYANFSL
jgi:hypothetical protein